MSTWIHDYFFSVGLLVNGSFSVIQGFEGFETKPLSFFFIQDGGYGPYGD